MDLDIGIPAKDKPLETLRQEVIDQLVLNYAHEHISLEAFGRNQADVQPGIVPGLEPVPAKPAG